MPAKVITEAHIKSMIDFVSSGWTQLQCRDWLEKEHGISVTRAAVLDAMKRYREADRIAAKTTASNTLSDGIPKRMRALRDVISRLEKIVLQATSELGEDPFKHSRDYASLMASYQKALELYMSGAGVVDATRGVKPAQDITTAVHELIGKREKTALDQMH